MATKKAKRRRKSRFALSKLALGLLGFAALFGAYAFFFLYRQFVDLPQPAQDLLDRADSGAATPLIAVSILFIFGLMLVAYTAAVMDGIRNTSILRSFGAFLGLTTLATLTFAFIAVFLYPQDQVFVGGRTVNEWEIAALEYRIDVDRHFANRPESYWEPYRAFVRDNVSNAFTQEEPFERAPSPMRYMDLVKFFAQDAWRLLIFFGDLKIFTVTEMEPEALAAEILVMTYRMATLALAFPVLLDAWRALQKRWRKRLYDVTHSGGNGGGKKS